jgi:fatty acid desaturase
MAKNPILSLRKCIIADLPLPAFTPCPLRLLWFIPLICSILGLSYVIIRVPLLFPLPFLISLLIGILYSSMFFFGHEISHGAIVRTRWVQNLLLYVTFSIFCLSPHLWRVWHVRVHHTFTNRKGWDPDNYKSNDEFKNTFLNRLILRIAPGSENWMSILFLPTWFTIFCQHVLWVSSQRCKGFGSLNRSRAALESFGMLLFWVLLILFLDTANSFLLILIPMMTANAVVMSYIITNHWLRPLSPINNPVENTMSVTTSKFFDFLFFHFSHHVEHHLFPSMSSSYLPLVRKSLKKIVGEKYLSPPHWKAIVIVFTTPRVYKGDNKLIDPLTEKSVYLSDIETILRQ